MTTKQNPQEFNYRLLDRLRSDCEYYLGNGDRSKKHLWAGDEKLQIVKMKSLYKSLKVKPEWLKWAKILEYEKKMVKVCDYCYKVPVKKQGDYCEKCQAKTDKKIDGYNAREEKRYWDLNGGEE